MKKALIIGILLMSVTLQAAVVNETKQYGFKELNDLVNSSNYSITQRWEALMKAVEMANDTQLEQLLKLTKNKDWYLRNGLLVALDKLGTDHVYEVARTLISDKSLVVRSASVDILSRINSNDTRQLLFVELNKKYNFVGQKSLWIRSQIVEKLLLKPGTNEKSQFAKLLFDKDKEIALKSAEALEKIMQVKFSGENKLEDWQKFVKEKKLF